MYQQTTHITSEESCHRFERKTEKNVNDKELVSVPKFIEFLKDQREFDFS